MRSRSQARGPLSVWKDGEYVFTCEGGIEAFEFERAVYLECAPGDVQPHHGLMVHASAPNPTDDICTTLTTQYAAAGVFAYTAPVIDTRHRNQVVRGEPPRTARVEAGTIELPPDFTSHCLSHRTPPRPVCSQGSNSVRWAAQSVM